MSHYTVTIVLPEKPKNAGHAEQMISELVAPFDENESVEPYKSYERPLAENWRDLEPMKLGWPWSYLRRDMPEVDVEDLHAVAAALTSDEEDAHESERYGVDEKGLYHMSTYNPQSKWDWWTIGGRWSGFYPIEGGMADIVRKGDVIMGENVLENIQTYACLAEGVWKAPGEMVWFGMSTEADDERDAYSKWFKDFWNGMPDDAYLAVVDMHI